MSYFNAYELSPNEPVWAAHPDYIMFSAARLSLQTLIICPGYENNVLSLSDRAFYSAVFMRV